MRPTTPMGDTDQKHPAKLHRWFLGFTSIGGISQVKPECLDHAKYCKKPSFFYSAQMASTDLVVSRLLWFVLFTAGAALTILNVHQVRKVETYLIRLSRSFSAKTH